MKIEKFLDCVLDKLLNYPDIDLTSVKMLMDKFSKCLSANEHRRWSIKLQLIQEFTLKQITIDEVVHREKTKQLDNQLIQLKQRGNNNHE